MTGATSGLGKVAAFEIASKGTKLIASYRNKKKADLVLKEYQSLHPEASGNLSFIKCNLSSFESVKKACDEINEKYEYLDQLILNAGVWHFKPQKSDDGIEDILQVNLLAPHLMIDELLPLIEKSNDGRIILTSSGLHQGEIQFDDIEFSSNFKGISAYRQSKLAVILLTRLIDKSLKKSVGIYCQHPGVVNTDLGRHAGWISRTIFKLIGTTAEKGARTLLHLVQAPKSELVSGEYYANSKLKKTTKESYNLESAKRLVDLSLEYRKIHL